MDLDAAKPQRMDGPRGAVLKKMEGKEVLLELTDSLYQRLMKVEGLNAEGKVLEPYSFASAYRPATVWLEQMERGIVPMRQVRVNMQAGLYTSTDSARAAIREALPDAPPEGAATQGIYKQAYVFRGTVATVRIHYQVGNHKVSRQFVLRGATKKTQQEDDPIDIRNR
jgi:hypothetical protein